MKHYSYKTEIKNLTETSEIEITSYIEADEFSQAIESTLEEIALETEIPGFRKGSAPIKLIREKIGENALLAESAERAIGHAYGHILEDQKIDAIGAPKVTITKMAVGNNLEFKIITSIMPKLEEIDYKKIALEENKKPIDAVIVTDEEFEKEKEKVGDKIPDFKKEDLIEAKEYRAKEKKRLQLIDALVKEMKIVIPDILIESELRQMIEQMKNDITRMGLTFNDYLKHLNKTEDDIKNEIKPDAIKRIKVDILLSHIAEKEKISADKEKVEAEVKNAKEQYKDLDENRLRTYFKNIFTNQKVFDFLESQK